MIKIREINGIKGYKNEDIIFLNLEDIARKIGMVKETNNSIRWSRINDMISSIMSNLPPDSKCIVDLGGYAKLGANTYISLKSSLTCLLWLQEIQSQFNFNMNLQL